MRPYVADHVDGKLPLRALLAEPRILLIAGTLCGPPLRWSIRLTHPREEVTGCLLAPSRATTKAAPHPNTSSKSEAKWSPNRPAVLRQLRVGPRGGTISKQEGMFPSAQKLQRNSVPR